MSLEGDDSRNLPDNTILIIFGASGDLTRRKLMPAMYHLSREDLLPENFHVIGLGRRIFVDNEFKDHMKKRVIQYCSHKMDDRFWKPIADNMETIQSDYKKMETFEEIKKRIQNIENTWKTKANLLFYLATSPGHFYLIIESLAKVGFHKRDTSNWVRIIVEKPFGLDLRSSDELNSLINEYFKEEQIFRIDHFLGKEAVQNILVFRMSNLMFQPLWNRDYIESIQITSAETIGVEGRVDFFEQTGAVRDMIQSHLLQILALLTMEPPASLDPEEIRDQKVLLLKSIRKVEGEEIGDFALRGQYKEGVVNSELVPPYWSEPGVNPDSKVETYALLKLFIDNYRWRGVPVYLRTGKRMPRRKTEIYITLKSLQNEWIPGILNKQHPIPNTIRLEIQPRAGIDITIGWKPAGLLTEVVPINLNLGGKADMKEPKAYERLLIDALRGDSTLFIRYDEIREMWKVVDPIVKYWEEKNKLEIPDPRCIIHQYPAGTQGPKSGEEFIGKDDFNWNKI